MESPIPAALVQENNLSVFKSICFGLLIFHILYLGSYSLFLGFYVSFCLLFWPHISGLLTLCWPFGQYVLCLYFYAIAG